MSGYALKAFSGFSKAKIIIHDPENIPEGSLIFTANHFTRLETVLLPYHIHSLIKKPVWSLAASELFEGGLKGALEAMGAVSTKDPDRDLLIVKSLLSGDSSWIIFPEGMMVKNKKLVVKQEFQLSDGVTHRRPHTGAATLGLRNEFYRERLRRMQEINPDEFDRLVEVFDIKDVSSVLERQTFIVPVNITYYPIRARENMLSSIAQNMMDNPSPRVMDELMTEGTMVLSGVDVDIRFGKPIRIKDYFDNTFVESDLSSRRKIEFNDRISSRPVMREFAFEIMQRYMADVYGNTTLNYDHIFASLLRYLPDTPQGIDEYDFRCRAFLAVTGRALASDRFLHKEFYGNQSHLLINDRFNRFRDFLQAAAETGVIEIKEGRIFKDASKCDTCVGFHQIRIENPVSVMANEVEPMEEMQQYLKMIAQIEEEKIGPLVKQRLIKKTTSDFKTDYTDYFLADESKPESVGKPILLESDESGTGVLLIHGYMAAPEEMRPFAEHLHARGFTVYVPRIKGHGTAPEDLAETSYDQWIESVEEGYVILRHTCDRLFMGGFSTGAGLALELATRVGDVKALFAVAPPMKLKDFGSHFVPTVDIWNRMMNKARLKGITKEFIANNPENPDINYIRNPVAGIRQLETFMEALASKLPTIQTPILVVQSRKDPVVNPSGTLKLFRKIGSGQKEYFLFDIRRHGILRGEGVDRVYHAISDFLVAEDEQLNLTALDPLTDRMECC